MAELNNPYYSKLKIVVSTALAAFEDGKVSMSEVWTFLLTLGDAIKTVLAEAGDLSDDDLVQLKEAATLLYDEYVLPLDIPGPDWLVDPLLRNGILPGLVEGAFILAKKRADAAGGDEGDGGE